MTLKFMSKRYLLCTFYFFFTFTEQCQNGWFGSQCQYKCHCEGRCDDNGCHDKCEDGWFGFQCQYQDLTSSLHAFQSRRGKLRKLGDDNDITCINDDSFTVDLDTSYFIRWMRIVVVNSNNLSNLHMHFRNAANNTIESISSKRFVFRGNTIDIHVWLNDRVRYIIFDGNNYTQICSLHISGGRNVALKQNASQSTTRDLIRSNASLAVDGNTDGDFFHGNSCTHTAEDKDDNSPTWTLIIPPNAIHRIVLYNRIHYEEDVSVRLRYFHLTTYDIDNVAIFDYQDTNSASKRKYTVFPTNTRLTNKITITATDTTKKLIMTLCEVEVFADCSPGTWGLECDKPCQVCDGICRPDDGTCDTVCTEDSKQCVKKCRQGKWGQNCNNVCSKNCLNNEFADFCDQNTGFCKYGCKPGYLPSSCIISCWYGKWGVNCSNTCSENCKTGKCNIKTGECDQGCKPGYQMPNCVTICSDGFFGTNCSKPCPIDCQYGLCHFLSGQCFNITLNYDDKNKPSFVHGLIVAGAMLLISSGVFVLVHLLMKRRKKRLSQKSVNHVYAFAQSADYESNFYERVNNI